jgi:dTMP kinase
MAGWFVTFEGVDGSGKSTQLARVTARLAAAGIVPLVTREPGGTPLGERIRAVLLDPGNRPGPLSEAHLMVAARADLVATVIAPALAAGRMVLCDRHADSTIAYQGYGRGLDVEMLRSWNRAATVGLTPDLTLLYDLDPAAGIERRAAAVEGSNRIDREPLEFHRRVRRGFLDLAHSEPGRFVVLDASGDPREIEERSWSAIERILQVERQQGR